MNSPININISVLHDKLLKTVLAKKAQISPKSTITADPLYSVFTKPLSLASQPAHSKLEKTYDCLETKFCLPAKFELKRIKTAKVVLEVPAFGVLFD